MNAIYTSFAPKYVSMTRDVQHTYTYMKKRKSGELQSALTPFNQLNDYLLDGIPWGSIVTIVGTSSSGKSTVAEAIKYHILENDKDVIALSIEGEMLIRDQIMRQTAKRTGLSLKQLKYAKGVSMTKSEEEMAFHCMEDLKKMNIFNIDSAPSVEELRNNILYLIADKGLGEGSKLLVTIDYVSLIKSAEREDKKRTLDNLYDMIVEVKKELDRLGINIIFICLSQANRNVFTAERIKSKNNQYPTDADIYQSSSLMNGSDVLIFIMNPSRISGIDNSGAYGPYNFPIRQMGTQYPYLYFHILKNRHGQTGVLSMVANFARYSIYDSSW